MKIIILYIMLLLVILSSCNQHKSFDQTLIKADTELSSVERRYLESIFYHLQPYWKLPEDETWDPDLVSIVVIKLDRSGDIERKYFEQSSNNRIFDDYVLQALRKATPFPSIPAEIENDEMEIGLRFTINSLQ